MSEQPDDDRTPQTYHYIFTFPNGKRREFTIRLDPKTLALLPEERPRPAWTKLSYQKCPNCPLQEARHEYCPAAVSLIGVADLFKGSLSYEEVEVCVETETRRYVKRTTLQKGLSSLIGLYMVTSGCPVVGKLRPMASQHLPFAKLEETKYRVLSMYLLAQYFLARHGERPDWTFERLVKIYEDIQTVNQHFSKRLLDITTGDANLNALTILNIFADTISFSIDENLLGEIEGLFQPYFESRSHE